MGITIFVHYYTKSVLQLVQLCHLNFRVFKIEFLYFLLWAHDDCTSFHTFCTELRAWVEVLHRQVNSRLLCIVSYEEYLTILRFFVYLSPRKISFFKVSFSNRLWTLVSVLSCNVMLRREFICCRAAKPPQSSLQVYHIIKPGEVLIVCFLSGSSPKLKSF